MNGIIQTYQKKLKIYIKLIDISELKSTNRHIIINIH